MENITFTVPGINCGHCENTIQMEVGDLEGVVSVSASSDTKKVLVEFKSPVTETVLRELLTEINYPAES